MQIFRQPCLKLPGGRLRPQIMNEAFGGCPSLLDSLVWYPIWVGSSYIDMITGGVLTQPATAVNPTDELPLGEQDGVFASASSQVFTISSTSSLFGGSKAGPTEFTVGAWVKPSVLSGDKYIISKYQSSSGIRDWILKTSSSTAFYFMAYDVSNNYDSVNSSGFTLTTGNWHMVLADIDPIGNTIGIKVNDYAKARTTTAKVYNISTGPFEISSHYGYYDGSIGPLPIWKRLLSDDEQTWYYNNGLGININEMFTG